MSADEQWTLVVHCAEGGMPFVKLRVLPHPAWKSWTHRLQSDTGRA